MLSRTFRTLCGIRAYSSHLRSSFVDPFSLPLSPENLVAKSDEGLPLRVPRENESIPTLRARLIYQSRKRGTLEADLLLGTFANEYLMSMSEEDMREFDRVSPMFHSMAIIQYMQLMDEPDWDIYYWAVGKRALPARWASSPLLANLKKHAANEGKVVRRMPDLRIPGKS